MNENRQKRISEIVHNVLWYNENPGKNYLQRVIAIVEKALGVNITYININRNTASDSRLDILRNNAVHSSSYCLFIKEKIKGQKYCYICKMKGIKKCMTLMEEFDGMCIMGVHDIVKPVIKDDELFGILYLSGIRYTPEECKARELINKHCKLLGRYEEEMLKEYLRLTPVNIEGLGVMEKCLEELRQIILDILNTMKPLNVRGKEISGSSGASASDKKWIYNTILPYIEENYKNNVSLEELAETFFINSQYLCRLFKSKTGMNFKQYITQLRIEEAKAKLTVPINSITDIALSTGFNDPNYFSRVFKDNVGMTPSEYRKSACPCSQFSASCSQKIKGFID